MKRYAGWFLAALLGAGSLTGCVERRYVVTTDPPGATVQRDGRPLGATPVDDYYIYYGTYHFTIVKPGFQTLQVNQEIPTPWYEYAGLDFFFENLWPWRILDKREFHYDMVPVQQPRTDELLRESENLRNRAATIQPPPGAEAPP
jgi:hypothetical protein